MNSNVSLIIPSYNMSEHLPRLFNSLDKSGLLKILDEVVFVDDGSTDSTLELINFYADRHFNLVKVVCLLSNKGRFLARLAGAKEAKSEKLLFLDTRLELEDGFNQVFVNLIAKHSAIMGIVNIDTTASIFSLYWERTHRVLFRRHFRDAKNGFFLTYENYDQYLKGTTIFVCPRSIFIDSCEAFSGVEVLADDMALMKVIVQKTSIWVDASLAIRWWPRENYRDFLLRIWERGPSFVEYHVFSRKSGFLFWLVFFALISFFVALCGVFFAPFTTSLVIIFICFTMALSVIMFTKSLNEFLLLFPLHFLTLTTFGFAVLRGLIVNIIRYFFGEFPKIPSPNQDK